MRMDTLFQRQELEYTIQEYIYDLERPITFWEKDRFNQMAYSIWAAEEVLNILKNDPDGDSIDLIERYANRMNNFSLMNKETSLMFSIAYDTAMNLLDLAIAMMWKG